MAKNPAEGWYPSPNHEGFLRYWDGAAWTEHEKPVSEAAAAKLLPAPAGAPLEVTPKAKATPAVKAARAEKATKVAAGVGIGAAGAALTGYGAVGLKKGFRKIAVLLIVGASVWLISLFMLIGGIAQAWGGAQQTQVAGVVTDIQGDGLFSSKCIPTVKFTVNGTDRMYRPNDFAECTWEEKAPVTVYFDKGTDGANATLTKGLDSGSLIGSSLVLGTAGLFVIVIGLIRLGISAGSVAGGLLLLRQGFKVGTRKSETDTKTAPEPE